MELKRTAMFFMILASMVLWYSCAPVPNDTSMEITGDVSGGTTGTSISMAKSDDSTGYVPLNPDWKGYKGYIYHGQYVYRYSDERNKKWEERILKFANDFTDPAMGHVYFLDQEKMHTYIDPSMTQSNFEKNAFRREKYQEFVVEMEKLISEIHLKDDVQLGYALVAAVNGISESHTVSLPVMTKTYLLRFISLMDQGKLKLYCFAASKEHSNLIGAELKEINGVDIGTVLEKLMPYA